MRRGGRCAPPDPSVRHSSVAQRARSTQPSFTVLLLCHSILICLLAAATEGSRMTTVQHLLTRRAMIGSALAGGSQLFAVPLRRQALPSPSPLCDPDVSVLTTASRV